MEVVGNRRCEKKASHTLDYFDPLVECSANYSSLDQYDLHDTTHPPKGRGGEAAAVARVANELIQVTHRSREEKRGREKGL